MSTKDGDAVILASTMLNSKYICIFYYSAITYFQSDQHKGNNKELGNH
jgi:hypothetical protein